MSTTFLMLSIITLIVGIVTLVAGFIPNLTWWLRTFNIIVGSFMTFYSLWAMFFANQNDNILFLTILYTIPVLSVLISFFYSYGRISYGVKDFEQTLKIRKPNVETIRGLFKKKDSLKEKEEKEQNILEESIKKEPALLIKEETKTVVQNNKNIDFKLPDIN